MTCKTRSVHAGAAQREPFITPDEAMTILASLTADARTVLADVLAAGWEQALPALECPRERQIGLRPVLLHLGMPTGSDDVHHPLLMVDDEDEETDEPDEPQLLAATTYFEALIYAIVSGQTGPAGH